MYCTSCGVQARSGSNFCSVCGVPLDAQRNGTDASRANQSPEFSARLFGSLTAKLRHFWSSIKAISLGLYGRRAGFLGRAKRTFTDMNLVTRMLLIGIPSLVLAVILSPVLAVVCALAAVVGLAVLGFRIKGRKPKTRWGVTTGIALTLTILFTGISSYVYGFGVSDSPRPDSLVSERPAVETECGIYGCPDENGEYFDTPVVETSGIDDLLLLYPEFEAIIEDWDSSGTDMPLFLPTYVPFDISRVEVLSYDGATNQYYIWGDTELIRLVPIGPPMLPSEYFSFEEVDIDGQSYRYTEQTSFGSNATSPDYGVYPLGLWLYTEGGEERMYAIELNTVMNPLPYEEFQAVVYGLDRIDPSEYNGVT